MADATRRVSVRLSLDDAARVKAGLREVGETGQRSLDQIKGGAERASRSLELLDVAVRGIQLAGVAVAARALVQAGDALTQSLSRLQNATGSVERAGQVYEVLYRNALSTGVAVSESVDAFQRFSIAAREIGATSDQVVRLVGGLQRVGIVSGASTQEISSATLQLAQALASGVLQGDELRSILEAMPLLAEGLAKELGVSIGELRKLGSEGKLTAERVFPALLRATERLGAELDRAPLSLGRAFGQLTAATENFLGQLDRAIGLSNALARALSAAARAVDGVRQGAGLLSEEERFAGMRRQAEALAAQIARLESANDGRASLTAPVRRGSIRPGLVGAAEQQAGVDRAARLEELRRQYTELQAEITRGEQAAGERQRTEQETAAAQAAEARRRRATQDVQDLTRDLDDRFRINREYEERVRRLREAEAAGGVTAAERTRLETLALQERDEALRRLEPRVAAVRRASNEGARVLARFGLPLDVWCYHTQLPLVIELARAVPELTVVLDHLGGPLGTGPFAGRRDEIFPAWKRDILALAALPNVVVKLGGLAMEVGGWDFHLADRPPGSEQLAAAWRPWMETCLEAFGARRCMFESNFPVDKGMVGYAVVWNAFKRLAAAASEDEMVRLFSGTAMQVYRLEGVDLSPR